MGRPCTNNCKQAMYDDDDIFKFIYLELNSQSNVWQVIKGLLVVKFSHVGCLVILGLIRNVQ